MIEGFGSLLGSRKTVSTNWLQTWITTQAAALLAVSLDVPNLMGSMRWEGGLQWKTIWYSGQRLLAVQRTQCLRCRQIWQELCNLIIEVCSSKNYAVGSNWKMWPTRGQVFQLEIHTMSCTLHLIWFIWNRVCSTVDIITKPTVPRYIQPRSDPASNSHGSVFLSSLKAFRTWFLYLWILQFY